MAQMKMSSMLTNYTVIKSPAGRHQQRGQHPICANVANSWNITGVNAGTMGAVSFTSFQNLTGGTGANTFKVSGSGAWMEPSAAPGPIR